MTHLSTEALQKVADALVTTPRWAVAMASIGASEQLAFNWLSRSRAAQKADDQASPFYIEWRDTWAYWHEHCGRARKESLIRYEAIIRDQCANGIQVPVLDSNGQYVYRQDPKLIGMSDADLELLGYTDRLLRDKHGMPVIMMRTEQVPATTRNKVLELIPDYTPTTNVNVKSRSVVKVVGARRPPDLSNKSLDELKQMAKLTPPPQSGPDYGRHNSPAAPVVPSLSYARPQAPTDNPRGTPNQAPLDAAGRGAPRPPEGGFRVVR